MSGAVVNLIALFTAPSRPLLRLKLRDFTFLPRRAVPASPGGERCRFCKPILARARTMPIVRTIRPPSALCYVRIHARYERVSGSWRGSLLRRRQRVVAPTASVNPAPVTAGPELGLDLSRPISAVGQHIIAVCPCPIAHPAPGCRPRPHRSRHNSRISLCLASAFTWFL